MDPVSLRRKEKEFVNHRDDKYSSNVPEDIPQTLGICRLDVGREDCQVRSDVRLGHERNQGKVATIAKRC